MTIAIDFDGCVHEYSKGWQDGTIYDPPIPGAFESLRTLMQDHAVFIHTSRDPAQVATWITARSGIPAVIEHPDRLHRFWNKRDRLLVTDRKLPALAYIDDRGIRFTDWDQALADLRAAGISVVDE